MLTAASTLRCDGASTIGDSTGCSAAQIGRKARTTPLMSLCQLVFLLSVALAAASISSARVRVTPGRPAEADFHRRAENSTRQRPASCNASIATAGNGASPAEPIRFDICGLSLMVFKWERAGCCGESSPARSVAAGPCRTCHVP